VGGDQPRRRPPPGPGLSGVPVAVAVDLPRLELDRPFTYLLPEDRAPGTGLLVSVPFHGRTVRGWVLGPTADVPARTLPVRRVLSRIPLFDERLLALYRWVAERYVVPLSVAIGRSHPPRVASEEGSTRDEPRDPEGSATVTWPAVLDRYERGEELTVAARNGSGAFVVRPLPDDEATACVEAVGTALDGGREAVVIVPEAEPLPHTARQVVDTFRHLAVLLVGGERRERYRAWLDVIDGRYRVVVGTRPAVFAPVRRLGLVWVHREAHPAHREERAPYHHVREVALARAGLERAVCVLAGLSPSGETAALAEDERITRVQTSRVVERSAAPLVEVVRPAAEDRSPRLTALLRRSGGAFLMVSRHGYGVVRVCRDCGQPVRCARCGGPVTVRSGAPVCVVCSDTVSCSNCGSTRFGVERGGTERLEEWAGGLTGLPVSRVDAGEEATPPAPGRVVVGTAAAVKDFGPRRISLVAVLDPDRARRRAGLGAPEQALAMWMEASAWAGPRDGGGRVLIQTAEPADAAIQALIRWDPGHFHRAERVRRTDAGFPPGFPVFRVTGSPGLADALAALEPVTLLTSSAEGQTVCLVTLRPNGISRFRERVIDWAQEGTVTRVEAEPQL
jgi:primosomal protein N' (replication factor Y) (superfamily II helicase)